MTSQNNAERLFLDKGIAKLQPLLTAHGFEWDSGVQAISSGGPFANGFFRKGKLEIGLVVRDKKHLGCPSYSEGYGYAGHEDLFWALGHEGEMRLVHDYVEGKPSYAQSLHYKAKDGGDPFDAFLFDLEQVILPALKASQTEFSAALARAHKKFQKSLSGK